MTPACRLLYVDDESVLLEIGKLFLEAGGEFVVDTFTSAPEALLQIKTEQYDAIISDYQMPLMDGITFLRHLKASGDTTPFIIFTGRGREEIVIEALNEGADFYLQKGGEPRSQFAELAHKIRQAIQQRRAVTSIHDLERREADIIDFLPDATFAIDTHGVVIAWNRAMEKMTGVASDRILGRGNYEYSIPFYHERRPILIDIVLKEDPVTAAKYPAITRDGTTLFSEITIPHFNNGMGAVLWFTASPLYNTRGIVVGAIESIREITERKQAEEALNVSEKRFRELSDLLPQVVYETDINGTLTYANHIAFDLFGYSPEEFRQGISIMQMLAPGDRERGVAAIRAIFEGKENTGPAEEYLALRKDGSTLPISIYSSPVIIKDRITGLRGIIVDITDRKQAEKQLRESEEIFRSLVQESSDGIAIIDEEGVVIAWNSALTRITGIPSDEARGSLYLDLLVSTMLPDHRQPDRIQRIRSIIDEQLHTGKSLFFFRPLEAKIVRRDGEIRYIQQTGFPIRTSKGFRIGSIIHDITQRRQAGEALRESEQRYKYISETTTDFVFSCSRPADGTYTIDWLAGAVEQITGYTIEELRAMGCWKCLVHPDDRVVFDENIINLPAGTTRSCMLRIRTKSGTVKWLSVETTHVPAHDTSVINHVFGGCRDITERRQVEEQLKEQTRNLEKINQLAIEFASLSRGNSVTALAAQKLMELSGAAVTTFSVYNPAEQTLQPTNFEIAPGSHDKTIPARGKPPGDIKIPVSTGLYREIVSKIVGTIKTPPGAVIGQIPPFFNPVIRKQMDIDHFLGIAYVIEGELYGTSVLAIKHGQPEPSTDLLESFAHIVAISLRRDRAETTLHESEERLRSFIEQAHEGVSIVDDEGRIIEWNAAQEKITGISRTEALGVCAWDLATRMIPDEHRQEEIRSRMRESIQLTIKSGKNIHPDPVYYRFLRPDGTIAIANQTVFIVKTSKGHMIGTLNQDVTEQQHADEKIKESESSYRGLFNTIRQAIYILDPDGKFIDVNEGAEAMYGYARKEFLGKTPEFLSAPGKNELAEVIEKIHKAFAGEPQEFEFWGLRKNKEYFAEDIRLYKGTYFGRNVIIAIGTDIHERKRVEEELRESRQILEAIIDTIPARVFWKDRNLTYLGCNTLFARDAGFEKPEDMIGKDDFAMGWSRQAERYRADDRVVIESGRAKLQIEEPQSTPSGEQISLLTSKVPLKDATGKTVGVLGTYLDITERKRAEEALRQANRKLNLLSGITRHDIKNQLLTLNGFLELLHRKVPDPALDTFFSRITKASTSISSMIQFTKEYEHIGVTVPVWQNFRTLVETAAKEALPGEILIKNDLPGDAEVFADALIGKVCYNLMDNAVRYGGKITTIRFSMQESGIDRIILCEDDGDGIPVEEKEQIFERGFGKNTGLGLALSREILDITGISIRETGVPGTGARFEITVPKGAYRQGGYQ